MLADPFDSGAESEAGSDVTALSSPSCSGDDHLLALQEGCGVVESAPHLGVPQLC